MACTEKDLGPLATMAYGCLKKQFQSYNIYWKLGHSFDTVIDYFLLGTGYNADAADFGQIAYAAYKRSSSGLNNNACWYDDLCWWGIAALRASQYERFGPCIEDFKKAYMDCWQVIDEYAPNVWKRNGGNSAFEKLKPRFLGGVWNWDWTQPLPQGCDGLQTVPRIPPNCGDDKQGDNLGGIQNTVTNGLYLVLAYRLGQWDAANRELTFLNQWFYETNPSQSLLDRIAPDAVLVRERVSTYGVQDSNGYLHVCGYQPELAWAGDQGLILGAAVEALNHDPSHDPTYFQLARSIAAGVKFQIEKSQGGIMAAWVSGQGGDPGDYDTGVAVYMRYLLYAYMNNTQMKSCLRHTGYVDFVCKNASLVDEDKINQANDGNGPARDAVVDLTNYLSTLVAAIQMTRS